MGLELDAPLVSDGLDLLHLEGQFGHLVLQGQGALVSGLQRAIGAIEIADEGLVLDLLAVGLGDDGILAHDPKGHGAPLALVEREAGAFGLDAGLAVEGDFDLLGDLGPALGHLEESRSEDLGGQQSGEGVGVLVLSHGTLPFLHWVFLPL